MTASGRRRPTLLFVTDESPELIGGGALVYVNAVLNTLCRHFAVSVLVCDPDYHRKHACLVQDKPYEKCQPGFFTFGHRSYAPLGLLNKLSGKSTSPARDPNTPLSVKRDLVEKVFRRRHWDCVMVNYYWLCPLLDLFPRSFKAVLTHDVWHRHISFAQGGADALSAEQEAAFLNHANLVVAISEKDKLVFCQILTDTAVAVARPVITLPKQQSKDGAQYGILYVASGYAPNIEGLRWLSEHVCPLLPADDERYAIHVVGTICAAVAGECFHPLIRLEGAVFDIGEVYRQAGIVVAPILQGTGVKIKVVEALAYGLPLVVTPKAIEGIEYLQDYGVFAHEDPQGFAQSLVELVADEGMRESASSANSEAARRYFAEDVAHAELLEQLLDNVYTPSSE